MKSNPSPFTVLPTGPSNIKLWRQMALSFKTDLIIEAGGDGSRSVVNNSQKTRWRVLSFFFSIHQFGGTKMWTPGRLMKILSVKSCQYFPPVGPSFGLHLNNKRNTNRGNNGGGPHLTSRMIGTRPLSADWDFSPSFFLISHRVIWQSISGTLECHRQCARFPLPLLPGFHSFLPFDKYLGATSIKNPPPPFPKPQRWKKLFRVFLSVDGCLIQSQPIGDGGKSGCSR